MPDDRKRSRSPSDTDEPATKRHQSALGVVTPNDVPAPKPKKEEGNGSGEDVTMATNEDGTPATASMQIHMRCLIVTQDASIIIGKGGSHVNEIREKSGAKVMVSESIPGNPERILNVSGALDAVSKVRIP